MLPFRANGHFTFNEDIIINWTEFKGPVKNIAHMSGEDLGQTSAIYPVREMFAGDTFPPPKRWPDSQELPRLGENTVATPYKLWSPFINFTGQSLM